MNYRPRLKAEGDSSSSGPQHRGSDRFACRPARYDIDVLLPNSYFKGTVFFDCYDQHVLVTILSRKREIVQNMSPVDSSLRTGPIWLPFVTCEVTVIHVTGR